MRLRHPARQGRRGAALVEFAMVAALLFLVLFGIVEMGLLFKDQSTIAQAAREAARSLSLGSPPVTAATRAKNAAATLPWASATWTAYSATTGTTTTGMANSRGYVSIVFSKSTPDSNGNPQTWTAVSTPTGDTTVNDANPGDFVRVKITYNHPLVTSYSWTGGTSGYKAENVTLIMRRE